MIIRRIAYGLVAWMFCAMAWGQAIDVDSLKAEVEARLDTLGIDIEAGIDTLKTLDEQRIVETLDSLSEGLVAEVLDKTKTIAGTDSIAGIKIPEVELYVPDPLRSFWLSLILPGAGQIYNHKYWKLPIVYGGFLGCVYALSWNGVMLSDYSRAYLDISDDDPNTKSYEKMLPLGYNISGKEERFKDIFKRKKNYYRKYRDMSIFAFAGVYLISVIDAYVDAELSAFDISRDLGLKWEPTKMNEDNVLARRYTLPSYGVQCALRF